ncbi:STAS domain-containing protein [Spirochaetota bacterium]
MISISEDTKNNISVISINGNFTIEHINEIETVFREVLAKMPEVIGISFKDVDYIDSIGINNLCKFTQSAHRENIELVIFEANKFITEIFHITKLDKIYRIINKEIFDNEYIRSE